MMRAFLITCVDASVQAFEIIAQEGREPDFVTPLREAGVPAMVAFFDDNGVKGVAKNDLARGAAQRALLTWIRGRGGLP